MHVQIVTFHLKDTSEAEYRALCDQVAPAFADIPGMIAKIFIANPGANTYGGVYTWDSREAMERFTRSELFAGVANDPHLADVTSTDYAVLEGPTRITHGLASRLAGVA